MIKLFDYFDINVFFRWIWDFVVVFQIQIPLFLFCSHSPSFSNCHNIHQKHLIVLEDLQLIQLMKLCHRTYNITNIFTWISSSVSNSSVILFKPTISFVSKNSSRSLRNNEKRKGDRFPPCLTPISQLKYSVVWLLYEIHDLTLIYILNITLYILPFMLLSNNLWKRPSLHTLSKAFSKPINAQYNFFFFDFKIWNSVNIEYILSSVE